MSLSASLFNLLLLKGSSKSHLRAADNRSSRVDGNFRRLSRVSLITATVEVGDAVCEFININ